jgi:DNA primase
LIPIRDQDSRICGFVGRNVGDDRWPKYKNPPRTHAYDKSVNLYQPLPAPAAGGLGQVVVVEGTLDAMAIAVAAIRSGRAAQFCPLTQSGRELSEFQLDRVFDLHLCPPVLGFDGDAAGRDSALRYAVMAEQRHKGVAVTDLPDGYDPASWLAAKGIGGLSAWARAGALSPTRPWPKPVSAHAYVMERGVEQSMGNASKLQVRTQVSGGATAHRNMGAGAWLDPSYSPQATVEVAAI